MAHRKIHSVYDLPKYHPARPGWLAPGTRYGQFKDNGLIYYFTKPDLRVHSVEDIHQVVNVTLRDCIKKWNWKIEGNLDKAPFVIFTHPKSLKALGYAYINARAGGRYISFGKDLLHNYDLAAIGRLAAHEFCHHYREGNYKLGVFPKGKIYSQGNDDAHDALFWEALRKVDPLAGPDEKYWSGREALSTEKLPLGKLTLKILSTVMYMIYVPRDKRQKEVKILWHPDELQALLNRIPKSARTRIYVHPKSKWSLTSLKNYKPFVKGKEVTRYIMHPITGTTQETFVPKENQYMALEDFLRIAQIEQPSLAWTKVKP